MYLSPAVHRAAVYNISVQLDGTLSSPAVQTFTVLDDPLLNTFKDDHKYFVGEVLLLEVSSLSLLSRDCSLTPTVAISVQLSTIRVKPSFVIFDIRAL